jgi:hypothetical protein
MNRRSAFGVAALMIAASVAYFLLIYVPGRDHRQNDRISERDCAARATLAVNELVGQRKQWEPDRLFKIYGLSNHYNRRLEKCFVSVIARVGDPVNVSVWMVRDAYEGREVVACSGATCLQNGDRELSTGEAERLRTALMTE